MDKHKSPTSLGAFQMPPPQLGDSNFRALQNCTVRPTENTLDLTSDRLEISANQLHCKIKLTHRPVWVGSSQMDRQATG